MVMWSMYWPTNNALVSRRSAWWFRVGVGGDPNGAEEPARGRNEKSGPDWSAIVTDASVHLAAQPRLDTLVTEFRSDAQRLRTDFAGRAWIGDLPDPASGMMGPRYQRRDVDSQLFLPDTHWYTAHELDDAEMQLAVGLLQVPGTTQGTQGAAGRPSTEELLPGRHPRHDSLFAGGGHRVHHAAGEGAQR